MKEFWVILSDKGGVGKSTFASICFEHLFSKTDNLYAIDCDVRVPKFSNICGIKTGAKAYDALANRTTKGGVLRLDVKDDEKAEELFDLFKDGFEAIIVDLPGGMTSFASILGSNKRFIEQFVNVGYRFKVFNVIDSSLECAQQVKNVMNEWIMDGVDYYVLRSGPDREGFPFFDKAGEFADEAGNPAEYVLQHGGKILDMPHVKASHFSIWDARKVPFGSLKTETSEELAATSEKYKMGSVAAVRLSDFGKAMRDVLAKAV